MKIPTFYWLSTQERAGNFGDILTPYILDYFNISFKHTKVFKGNIKIDAICIGSIIERAAHNNTVVLGAGVMTNYKKVNPNADYRLVRGPITRDRIISAGGICSENYGDPGFLLPLLFDEHKKEHDVGFIPHLSEIDIIKEKYPNEFIINLQTSNPKEVVDKITKCRSIVSSSLHGIITAHAYGIPAAWAWDSQEFPKWVKWTDTKFLDYYRSINVNAIKSSFNEPIFSTGSLDIKNIINVFEEYTKEIKN